MAGSIPLQQEVSTQSRIAGFDALRLAAAFAVVWGHVATFAVYWKPDAADPNWLFADFAFAFSRWAVPVFLMMMGTLWATRGGETFSIALWRRRLLRIVALTLASSLLYLTISIFVVGDIEKEGVLGAMMGGLPFHHLWFLYLATGIYFFAPIVMWVWLRLPRTLRFGIIGAVFLASLFACWPGHGLAIKAIVGLAICSYFVIGIELARWPAPGKSEAVFWGLAFVASGTAAAVTGAALVGQLGWGGFEYPCSFGHVFVAIMAVSVFRLAPLLPASAGVQRMARATPLIYVLHPIGIIFFFAHRLQDLWKLYPVGIPVVSVLVFATALAASMLLLSGFRMVMGSRPGNVGKGHVSQ
ncbi:acyltransferase [Aestuariivirga litoralis]|uniref:acyltransferase n=1 Tax=Aestuariivirga litoralis TaxID=2650924 RepID=UPI0018C64657|nr:acyltransferase family protein [Aestuariivirga litoralis]MBG1231456.1 acyltransferase family protein [Aestuariivirga litoralis]